MRLIAITALFAVAASAASAQPVSGSAARANGGGAGPVDPTPGYESPTPTIVGGGQPAPAAPSAARPALRVSPDTRCIEGKHVPHSRFGEGGDYRCTGVRR